MAPIKWIIILPIFLICGCVARSEKVDLISRDAVTVADVVKGLAVKSEDPILIYKATQAEKQVKETAKTPSAIDPMEHLPSEIPGWMLGALGPLAPAAAGGYMLLRKLSAAKKVAREVADMTPEDGKKRAKEALG